jgi:HEPN superfamily AbiU2-like protein
MKARPYRSRYNETFSDYSDYFTVAMHSHFSALVLALWRLHDPDAPAISLQTLPGRMGLRPAIPVEMLRTYRDRLRPVRTIVTGLHTIRHKFFAHRDPGYTVEQAFKEAGLKYGDLKKLVDASAASLNLLLRARRLGPLTFARPMDGATVRLIRVLHKHAACTSNDALHRSGARVARSGR